MPTTRFLAVFAAVLTAAVGVGPAPASADYFTSIPMDDSFMNFGSDETNADHFLYWNHFVHYQNFDEYDARTDHYGGTCMVTPLSLSAPASNVLTRD